MESEEYIPKNDWLLILLGAQWLSGRVLDLRRRGCGFETHRHYGIVSLSKIHYSLFSTGSNQEDLFRHNWKIVDWDVKNQIKQRLYSLLFPCRNRIYPVW